MNRCLDFFFFCVLFASACGPPTAERAASPDASPALVLSPPLSFGRGFTDLTALSAIPEFVYSPPGARDEPESTTGHFADLDGDGRAEVILTQVFGDSAPAVYRYDIARGLLVPAPDLVLPFRPIGAIDLDGDGVIDLLGFSLDDIDRDGRLDVLAGTRLGCSKSNDVRPKLRGAGAASSIAPISSRRRGRAHPIRCSRASLAKTPASSLEWAMDAVIASRLCSIEWTRSTRTGCRVSFPGRRCRPTRLFL